MADFDFSLPPAAPVPERGPSRGWRLLLLVQGVCVVFLACWLPWRLSRGAGAAGSGAVAGGGVALGHDEQSALAQRLERQGLAEQAARAWEQYLAQTPMDAEKAAKLWYRVGTIQQDARRYDEALASYYRSESLAKVPVLETEITRRSQECLEALGNYSGLRRNLEERTSVDAAADQPGDEVLVEIGTWRLTRAEVDRRLEQMLDQQLAGAGAQWSAEQRREQKQAALKRMLTPSGRQQFLQQFVAEELLYREARAQELTADAALREELRQAERSIMANALLRQRLAGLSVSDADARDYYEAHQAEEFTTPAGLRLAHIQLPDAERAEAALNSLKGGMDFAKLAEELSDDEATAAKGGELPGWLSAEGAAPWQQSLLAAAMAAGEKQAVLPTAVKSDRGWHVVRVLERRAAAVRPYDEATAREAQQRVLSRRRNDLQNELFKELAERYRVTWHQGEQAAAGGVAPPANSQTAPAAPAPVPASAPAPTKQD